MGEEMEKFKNKVKIVLKKHGKRTIMMFLPIIIIIVLLASFIYFITIDDGTYKEDDWTSTPFGAAQYTSNVTVSDTGELKSSMTAQELWDKMIKEGSRVNLYLDNPEQLLKLMNAEMITQFMDTRANPNDPIDWEAMTDVNSNNLQGIIKLKRASSDGGDKTTMTYVDPDTFQSYINEYNSSGSEEAKKNALSHFTLGSNITANSGTSGSAGSDATGTNAKYYSSFASSNPEELNLKAKKTVSNVRTTVYGAGADENSGYENQTSSGINLIDENGVDRHIVAVASDASMRIANIGDWVYLKNKPELGFFLVADIGPNTPNWMDIFDHRSDAAASVYGDYNDVVVISKETVEAHMKGEDTTEVKDESSSESEETTVTSEEWCWPTDGTTITSYFGPRKAPLPGASTDHGAIDIGVPTGTNVYACDGGTVTFAAYAGNAGNMVTIDHGNGYTSTYMHNSQFKVSAGDTVTKGQVIALSGNTGNSTGPHLHFQVQHNGTKVDPLIFKYSNGMGDGSVMPNSGSGSSAKYYAVVASWNENTDKIESDDPDQETYTKVSYNMSTTNINYQDLVSGYTMPFDYLWSMLVITEDKNFVFDLADLVYDSEIEITVHDNLTTNTNVNVYTYTKKKKTETEAMVTASGIKGETKNTISDRGNWTDEDEKDYTTTFTTITKTNTLDISVTLADVWMAKFVQDYEYQIPDDVVTNSGGAMDDIPYPDEPSATGKNDTYGHAKALLDSTKKKLKDKGYTSVTGKVDYVKEKIYYSTISRNESITNTVKSTKYVSSPMIAEEKTDPKSEEPNFVTIFLHADNSKAKNNILSVESWLFELLETNESTKDLLDLTKYLLYKATGTNYGVTEYDFNALYKSNLTSVGGGDYIVDITKSSEDLVIKDVETLKKAFSGYSASEKLIEHAEEFLELQEKYKVNAVFAAAVSISETGAGRAGHAVNGKNNWFNIECTCGDSSHGRFETYESAKKSIERFYWQISEGSYYFTAGRYSVVNIGKVYCPAEEGGNLWIENTLAFMTQMFKAAGIDVNMYAGEGVQFYQGDYAHIKYGGGTLKSSGCGPTCFAMVASQISGKQITPADAVAWCGNRFYVSGVGTSWDYFAAATSHFNLGVTVKQGTISEAVTALRSGKLVISSQDPGLFTSGGHFILLYKIDESGNIYVKDPNKNNAVNKGYNTRAFTQSEINAAAKTYFIFQ